MRIPSFAFVLALLLAVPSVALAGGCPTCTTASDCMPPGGGTGYCVEWSRDFGCGGQRIACCPGQGCDTFSGRPSCEGVDNDGDGLDDCTVIGDDAGVPAVDAGPSGSDAGPSGSDAGPSGSDAGPSGSDAGPSGSDAGPGGTPDGGCGCSVGGGPSLSSFGLLGLLGLGVLIRLRRRAAVG